MRWVTFVHVPLKDKPGRLHGVAEVLGQNSVNIEGLDVDKGGVRLLTNDAARCVRVLEAHGYKPEPVQVLDVAVEDRPGGLAAVLGALASHEVNIESTFGVANIEGGHLYIVVDKPEEAVQALGTLGRRLRA